MTKWSWKRIQLWEEGSGHKATDFASPEEGDGGKQKVDIAARRKTC